MASCLVFRLIRQTLSSRFQESGVFKRVCINKIYPILWIFDEENMRAIFSELVKPHSRSSEKLGVGKRIHFSAHKVISGYFAVELSECMSFATLYYRAIVNQNPHCPVLRTC